MLPLWTEFGHNMRSNTPRRESSLRIAVDVFLCRCQEMGQFAIQNLLSESNRFGMEKLKWCGYPTVTKISEDTVTRFDRIHERDRRTDTA